MKKTIIAATLGFCIIAGYAYARGGHGWNSWHGQGACGYYNDQIGQGNMMGQRGMGCGFGMRGNGSCAFYSGQNARPMMWQDSATQQKFFQETLSLRKELHSKRFDLREARRNPQSTPEQIGALEKQIIDLQTKISQKVQTIAPATEAQ
ncbi:hypothetical protein [Desulfogranum japonicum]|uniref:hypothetical protein n=1 Tax=Desulfogranum japonicum TaxID=231447 RepID=UPI000409D413|nr:hypothetical protein [Desulfogranum japonicum]